MSARVWGGAAALLLCVTACGDSDDGSATDDGSSATPPQARGDAATQEGLDGKTFVSTSVSGHDLVEGTTVRLVFDEGRLAVEAGCNTQTAQYTVDASTLRWSGPPASTMMACPDPLHEQDLWLTGLFTDGAEMTVTEDGGTLTAGEVTMELGLDGSAH
ncbi:MAG TPA: META domain-containing protein [Nocardioides sp.]|uniref:META domain-containing protein n=1 Tax=Nocardioides sp. TaxID=35761 RepID=UPI002E3806EC|nr:META domain-containing protein [Nocardioides sp.]HEX5087138.1 META domain-containing protein [Nocardioides sp.]